ncbi:MAG: GNAT family N-acetyltransferase [Thermoleophilia bacterium]|nr:GNAT family N-acetyltransferase [Thermoleophilia bacterium]
MADLVSLHSPNPYDVLWVEREWTEPGFDLEADARLTGEGYIAVWDGRGGKAWLDIAGAPGGELLEWAERRAREKGLVRALGSRWQSNAAVQELLEGAGYSLVRSHYRMWIDLDTVAAEPVWPDGLTVRTFRPGDERLFYDVHQETFADHWEHEEPDPYEEWVHWLLQPPAFEPSLWLVAEEAGEPAGIAICNRRVELPNRGYVQILGVRRRWRRRGVGLALLLHAFHEFKRVGLTEADLGVDAASITGATRLYERAGMQVVAVAETYEKRLR